MNKQIINLTFYECEHNGDLQYYLDDLPDCIIISTDINIEAEIGHVTIEVKDKKKFWKELKEKRATEYLT